MHQAIVKRAVLCFLVCCCCLLQCSFGQLVRDYEAELVNYLKGISNYSPLLYPKLNRNATVYVSVGKMIGRLVAVDSAKQSVKIGTFMLLSWEEERLVWNSSKFDGISVVNWDSTQVWFPVMMVYNGIGDNQVLTPQIPVYLTSISPNRTIVTAAWRREFEFSCRFEMSRFPADEHTCELEFFFSDQGRAGNTLVRPVKSPGHYGMTFSELGIYQQSTEWALLNATGIATERYYSLFNGLPPYPLPTYVFQIRIRRLSNYYVMNIVIPLLLLTLLQVLLFFVPVDSGEKLGFGITIMLSYTVFLLLLDGIVPKSQTTPAIATFITAAMILSTISLLLTSLIMRFHFTPDGTQMPACARAVFVTFLGRLFCVRGANASVGQTPTADISESESSVQKPDKSRQGRSSHAEKDSNSDSDWVMAAYAIERLMVAIGVVAIAVIIGLFIIKPYAL